MDRYRLRRIIQKVRAFIKYGYFEFPEWMLALFSKAERMKLLNVFHQMGIREAEKYFILDPRSDPYPFLETFILKMYGYCDYKDKTIIDVGAQTGDSVLYFSYCGARKIYAFEPLIDNFRILENNVYMNKINCDCYNVGLGNFTGSIKVENSSRMARPLTRGSSENEIIKISRLDEYNIIADVLKIDVEGFEMEVLKGGLNTVKTAMIVIVETHSKELQVEVARFLLGLGFRRKRKIQNYIAKNVRVEYWLRQDGH